MIETRTIIVSIVVGLVVTLAAALTPALRATRVSPMAALLEAELPEGRGRGKIFTAVAVLLTLGGIGMTAFGLFGSIEDADTAAGLVGGGAVATLFGVSMFSPRLVRPLASVIGWPLERLRGITGRLARENAVRKPGRTAVTAGALMIGLAVVVFVTVFAAGISASVGNAIDRNFQGDIVLQNTDGFSPISSGAGTRGGDGAGRQDGLLAQLHRRQLQGQGDPRLGGRSGHGLRRALARLEAGLAADALLAVRERRGARRRLGEDEQHRRGRPDRGAHAARAHRDADGRGHRQGQRRPARQPGRDPAAPAQPVRGPRAEHDLHPARQRRQRQAVQDEIDKKVKAKYATVEALNQQELKDNQEEQIKQLVAFFYVLLALAIVISLLGIVTTLALSIHERTRELGMLRAVGMSRRQVRRLVRYEAVITALIGAILGTILGVIFAALVSRPLADEGFELAYPIGTLLILLVLAALAGVLAAILPARRAAKLDVLRALAYE